MLSLNDIVKKIPDKYVLVSVAERDKDGVALFYNVINHDSNLDSVLNQLKTYAEDENQMFILPTFKQTEDDNFIVCGDEVSEVLPANLYARMFRIHYGFSQEQRLVQELNMYHEGRAVNWTALFFL